MFVTAQGIAVSDDEEQMQDYFTSGECPALAYEIHKLTGWQIGMLTNIPKNWWEEMRGYSAHVFCFDRNGNCIDIYGRTSLYDMMFNWHDLPCLSRLGYAEFLSEMNQWSLRYKLGEDQLAKKWAKIVVERVNG